MSSSPSNTEPPRRYGVDSAGEFAYGPAVQTAFIDGFNFLSTPVQYTIIYGLAIFEGDIVLGSAEDIEALTILKRAELRGELDSEAARAIVITPGADFGWPIAQSHT